MKVRDNAVVSIEYTLKDEEGSVIETATGNDAVSYMHGAGKLIIGLERELEGREEGHSFQVTVPPDDGYGERKKNLLIEKPTSMFEKVENLQIGMHLQGLSNQGISFAKVTEIKDDTIILDTNHPLAGKTLSFDVTVKKIREASFEEINHRAI